MNDIKNDLRALGFDIMLTPGPESFQILKDGKCIFQCYLETTPNLHQIVGAFMAGVKAGRAAE